MFIHSKIAKKQHGLTVMGWILVAFVAGFFTYLGMLLFPVMVSNHTMGNILTTLQDEPGITKKSNKDILSLIRNRLVINGIKDVKTTDFEIVRDGPSQISIYLDYENRIEFIKNVYIVIINNKDVILTAK